MTQGVPPGLKLRVLGSVQRSPSPTRRQSRSRGAACAALAALTMTAALYLAGGPDHARARPRSVSAAMELGCLAIAAAATWAASSRSRSMTGRGRAGLALLALGTPALLAVWISGFHPLYAEPFERLGVRCFLLALATAPWPFAAMVAWRTTIDPHHPRLLGAAFGAAAGAWSGLTVVLWCPLADPGHVARGHLLPFVVFVSAGALLGRRLFGLTSR